MTIPIEAILRSLRNEHSMTQEQLAAAVGVTPQAVSRWEMGNGYPDIEYLPALADVFSVSTDELLGYRISAREADAAAVRRRLTELSETGTDEEYLSFARDAAARFPSDDGIRRELADAICRCVMDCDTPDPALLREAETLYNTVLSRAQDENFRAETLLSLSALYAYGFRDARKAKETCLRLSPMKYCRETALASGIGDGNTGAYIRESIEKLTDALGLAIRNLVLNEDLPNGADTWETKIEMLHTANRLYEQIFGDNLMFYHIRLSFNHWVISTYRMSLGQHPAALDSLENAARHAAAYDRAYEADHGKCYTSPYTLGIVYPSPEHTDFHEPHYKTNCRWLSEKLAHPRYDPIRADEDFRTLTEKLNHPAD